MKAIEFIYQDTEIHFLMNPSDENIMVNATEMAKAFNRRTEDFLKTKSTKTFIKSLINGIVQEDIVIIHPLNRGQIIDNRGRNGVYFHRELALDFAMWLDANFKRWLIKTIDQVLFGNYKEHWDAHVWQEQQIKEQKRLSNLMLIAPTPEIFRDYLLTMENIKKAQKIKRKAINNQYSLFNEHHS